MTGKRLTIKEFIDRSNTAHNNKYDYSLVNYINNKTKVTIICPEHGEFKQVPKDHMKGLGCAQCNPSYLLDGEKFIEKAKQIHQDFYKYDNVKYINSKTKVAITCQIHGEFMMTPNSHLAGQGCFLCRNEKIAKHFLSPVESVISRFKQVHSDKYDYSSVEYIRGDIKVKIICPIHGLFEQRPEDHLTGRGCPSCATYGFDRNKPAVLYYLKITTENGQMLYKIGITNRTVEERFQLKDLEKIEIVKQKLYENGQDAYDWEQKLLKMYKQYQYTGPNILVSGNTELFTEDIIAMYYTG